MLRLTNKQARFVDEYLVDSNGKQAAIRAGYAPHSAEVTASKLLRVAKVAAALNEKQAKLSAQTQMDAVWVMRELRKNHETAVKAKDLGASNRALELIGKHCGAFTEKVDLGGDLTINVLTGIPGAPGGGVVNT